MSSDGESSDSDRYVSRWEREYTSPERADGKPTTAPRLEKMASVSVAIALWNNAIVTRPKLIAYDPVFQLVRDFGEWLKVLKVSKPLAESIEFNFRTLRYNIQNKWIPYIYRAVFNQQVDPYKHYEHVGRIVWHSNGTINSAETVRNILKSNKVPIADKFKFACTYCLREEIEKLWPMMKEAKDENNAAANAVAEVFLNFMLKKCPLFCYWEAYCTDRLNILRTPENTSINEFMIQQRSVDNWPAIEYFFDRLNAEQQVTQAIWLIDRYGLYFQKFVLAKLNESQRLRVITDRGIQIIDNYHSCDGHELDYRDDFPFLTISTWYEFRDVITEQQFVDLFKVLVDNPAEKVVLIEVWNTCREGLKRHLLSRGSDDFLSGILEMCEGWPDRGFDLFSTVLTDHVSVDIRREITKKAFFIKTCKKWILDHESDMLDQLMNLSCFDVEELAKFKLSLTKTSYFGPHCKSLVVEHRIQELANLLNAVFPKTNPSSLRLARKLLDKHLGNLDEKCLAYYSAGNLKQVTDLLAPLASSYPEIITDYKSKLLKSRAGFKVCMKLFESTNEALIEIIADAFPANSAAEFKNKIIFSCEGVGKLQKMIIDGHSSNAEKWARLFLESDSDKTVLRTMLIDRLKEGKRDVNTKTRRKFMDFLL
ncbi:uncharacterized protein LOC135844396 isoform X4 [Planococcus citri]|uniref:uncharacterized protein LOC135844396 isoform X4 n=1 Tax=Planococcus citri TaxID=170843 RepID=UPI0031F95DAB